MKGRQTADGRRRTGQMNIGYFSDKQAVDAAMRSAAIDGRHRTVTTGSPLLMGEGRGGEVAGKVTCRGARPLLICGLLLLAGCASSHRFARGDSGLPDGARVSGNQRHSPQTLPGNAPPGGAQTGLASYYGPGFNGRPTASGERFDMSRMTAAHLTLPFNSRVRVTNLSNGKSVVVRINDRGPHVRGRIIDLSMGAAEVIGMRQTTRVRIEVVQ